MPFRLEPVVERVDGSHLVRGAGVGLVVDHGNQVLHLGSSPVVQRRLSQVASHPYHEHLCPDPTPPPDVLRGLSGTPVVSAPTTMTTPGTRSRDSDQVDDAG